MRQSKPKVHLPVMSYEKFLDALREFKFPEETDSYYDYIQAQRKEKMLFEEAVRGGMKYVDLFRDFQKVWANKALESQRMALVTMLAESVKDAQDTGDAALNAFTALCRRHDFWYTYSDDINVYRRGNESYDEIHRLIQAQPPGRKEVYVAYWNKIVKQNQPVKQE